jgi:hypothetical protein
MEFDLWNEESLIKDYKELLMDSIKSMEMHKGNLSESLITGYNCGMTDALTLFYRQVGKWEILFEMRKESLKEKQ